VPEWASTLIVVAVLLLVLFGMWQGWRALARRSAHLAPSHEVPPGLGESLVAARALYVATTAHEKPLERLAIAGLGFRAQGSIAVHRAGLVLEVAGSEDVWVPASDLVSAHPAQVAIDKAVERDGLLALVWRLGDETVDSYFRVTEPEKSGAIYDAIATITLGDAETRAAHAPRPSDYESEV
jgi:hypothetical protein